MKSEVEARFLEVNKQQLIVDLLALGAADKGEQLLTEVIFYDKEHTWKNRLVRLRTKNGKTVMTYKHHHTKAIDGAHEIEFTVPDAHLAEEFLENIGLKAYRHQEKKRHTFKLDDVTIDIDTWPNIPPYVELEGPSELHIQQLAAKLGFDWNDVVVDNAGVVLEKHYNIPVLSLSWFTFDKIA